MDDKELVRRIQNGQKEYLNVIADRYYDDIYNFCCYHSGNREDAYDLAQETFLRFIRYVGQYKYVNLRGYLLTVAMNVCRNYYRDKKEETEQPGSRRRRRMPYTGSIRPENIAGRTDTAGWNTAWS